MPAAIPIRAFSNASNVFIVWSLDEPIPNAIGFALYRYTKGKAQPDVVQSSVGFGDDPNAHPGQTEPTTVWPLQRCTWTDWLAPRDVPVAYQVKAVFETPNPNAPQSDVSNWITLTDAPTNATTDAFFNDGVIATQWIARYLGEQDHSSTTLGTAAATPNDPVRVRLGGQILAMLTKILNDALQGGVEIYAALFELGDPELVGLLKKFAHRAHVVLSNGSPEMDAKTKKLKEIDENKAVRAEIRAAGVDVRNRIFQTASGGVTPHLGHNKFLVVCDAQGEPDFVWTGSTNWTTSGLCTQMNNALVIRDKQIARQFKAQWDVLAAASKSVPAQYPPGGKAGQAPLPAAVAVDSAQVRATFTPWKAPANPKQIDVKGKTPADLAYCVDLINNAQEAILFLMFIPGPNATLMEAIQARNGTQGGRNLFVRGVANEDPGPTAKVPSIALAHRGELIPVPFDVVFPARVDLPNTFWLPELLKMPHAHAMIHSKVVIVDPFGKKPAVITGSHNQGFKASTANDENLVIVEGNADLAQQYAINIVTVFNQYWWRYNQMPADQQQNVKGNVFAKSDLPKTTTAPTTTWKGLVHAADWQRWQTGYLPGGDKRYELDFWFGRPMTVSKYQPPNNPRPPAKSGGKKNAGTGKKKAGTGKRKAGTGKKKAGTGKKTARKKTSARKKTGARKKTTRKKTTRKTSTRKKAGTRKKARRPAQRKR